MASHDGRYGPALMGFARDPKAAEPVRLAAVEAVGRIRPPGTAELIDGLIAEAKKGGSTPVAEAAIRALPDLRDANPQLLAMIAGNDYPLGLRREALRVYARPRNGGGRRVLELIKEQQAPRRPQERGDLDRPQRPRRPGPERGRQPPAAARRPPRAAPCPRSGS